jgi:hypothetical protein
MTLSDPLILIQTIMILCAVVAAICTTAGSWVKINQGDSKRRVYAGLTYGSYFFFFASIILFIIQGYTK